MGRSLDAMERFGGRRAVVIGGSMAGLIAARLLSDHFDEVTVIERDELPPGSEPRKGVPQGRHLHALLARGEEILSELFPGIIDALLQGGAIRLDFGRDVLWHHYGSTKLRFASGVMTTALTRPFLEAEVRRRVFRLPNVQNLDARQVVGLVASEGGSRVMGVRVRAREGGGEELQKADLVVDAAGRGSRTPEWLEALGFTAPPETTVKVHVGYATRFYPRVEPSPLPWKGLFILGSPPETKRLGAMFPAEGGRFLALVAGVLHDHPPSDHEGYLAFARSLAVDDLYRAIKDLEPLSDIQIYKFPSNLRRHYERLSRMPEGFVVLGDSLASFNPIYGQGMTTAGLAALTLDRCLREQRALRQNDLTGLSTRFQREVAKIIDVPWSMTTSEDFRYPEIAGKRPPGHAVMQWYLGRVHRATTRNREVLLNFLRAMHMLAPPTVLLTPRMVGRVLFG